MNLAVIGLILMFVLMSILIKDKLSPPVAFILLPLIVAVAGGFGTEAIGGFMETGFSTMLSTAVPFVFFISYFTLMSNEGLFDPIVHFLIKRMEGSITTMLFAMAITTFMVHLDGPDATTFSIVVLAFLPICKRLKARPEALLGTMCGMYGTMNIIPWGSPTMHAVSMIGTEVSNLYRFIMPFVAALAVIAFGIAFVIARIEVHNETGADKDDTAADEKGISGSTAKRKRLHWFSLGLTVLILALLFVDIGLPLHLIFTIASRIVLAVSYPNMTEQTKQLKNYAASTMVMIMTLFSMGIFIGVTKDSDMVEAMATAIVGILPAGVAPHMHWFMALLAAPLIMILGADASYHALIPTILGAVKQFRISPEAMAVTFLLTAIFGTPISPSVATVHVGPDLTGSTIGKHIKYSLRIL